MADTYMAHPTTEFTNEQLQTFTTDQLLALAAAIGNLMTINSNRFESHIQRTDEGERGYDYPDQNTNHAIRIRHYNMENERLNIYYHNVVMPLVNEKLEDMDSGTLLRLCAQYRAVRLMRHSIQDAINQRWMILGADLEAYTENSDTLGPVYLPTMRYHVRDLESSIAFSYENNRDWRTFQPGRTTRNEMRALRDRFAQLIAHIQATARQAVLMAQRAPGSILSRFDPLTLSTISGFAARI